jgi:hypothetical protein
VATAAAGRAEAGWVLRGTAKKIRQIKTEKEADTWNPIILFIMVLKGHYLILSNFSNQIKNRMDPIHATKRETSSTQPKNMK